ncbi:glycoside hydrolase family 2 protein [Thalassobellus suaedae]|uniref:Beta-glucuronidase n=1 Tax=Thalassobellus suaedae TaxID=3074124 RepID=A0ABY9XTL5_9FLAO|nr:glycoside hydrolase family 2 TIM barrel-domain containing protein [Flavobacteriaceae bacterium HL-DH14]
MSKIKNPILFFLLSLLTNISQVNSQEVFISNTQNRTFTSLNGKWKYVMDPYETGQIGFMPLYKNTKQKDKTDRVEYSFDSAQTLWVPGGWNVQKPELLYYEGSIWYRKTFDKENIAKDKRYYIYLGAANYNSTITFNGEILGKHEGGFTPFCYEVTHLIKKRDNYLIVGVNNTRSKDQIPAKVTDWFNHGGITRDVKLLEVPTAFVSNYFLSLNKSTLNLKTKQIDGSLTLTGATFSQKVKVIIPELKVNKEIIVDSTGTCNFTISVKNLDLWSPKTPKLYKVSIETETEKINDRIGFRTIDTKGKQILLNGNPVFLKGISLHDENPLRRDRANSIDDAKLVLGWAKQLGCNFIRLAHYPHQENIVRLADEMGIMLWEELPLYWGIEWDNPKVLLKAKKQYTELINRDYNRASSIIWSIANETTPTKARNEFLKAIAEHVKSLDNTRLLSAACKKDQAGDGNPENHYTVSDPIMKYLDIVSFNEYLGWYGGLPEECRKKTITSSANKPIIVSEFGGGALQGFYADKLTRWSEEYQENLYIENLAMFNKIDGLAGMTPWILVDFMSPLRQLPDIQDGWNRKGLISEKGVKKKAFYILQDYYKTK